MDNSTVEYQIQFLNDNQIKLSGRVEPLSISFVCSLDNGDSLWLRAGALVISVFAGLIVRAIEEMLGAIDRGDFQKTDGMLETIANLAEAGNEAQSRVREEMQRRGERTGAVYDFGCIAYLALSDRQILSSLETLPPASLWHRQLLNYQAVESVHQRVVRGELDYQAITPASSAICTATSG